MRKKLLAVAATSLVLTGVVAGVAVGAPKYFKLTVSPHAAVKPGAVLVAKGTGATPSTAYYCVIAAYSTKKTGVSAPDNATLKQAMSTSTGSVTCKVKYHPFKAKDNSGVLRHCPTTAADRKAGFKCGIAFADAATVGAMSESIAPFTPKQ